MYLYFYVTVYQHRTIFLVRFILYRPKLYLYVSTYVFVDLSVFLMILRRAASDEVIVVRTVVWVSLYIMLGISSLGILLLETPPTGRGYWPTTPKRNTFARQRFWALEISVRDFSGM